MRYVYLLNLFHIISSEFFVVCLCCIHVMLEIIFCKNFKNSYLAEFVWLVRVLSLIEDFFLVMEGISAIGVANEICNFCDWQDDRRYKLTYLT